MSFKKLTQNSVQLLLTLFIFLHMKIMSPEIMVLVEDVFLTVVLIFMAKIFSTFKFYKLLLDNYTAF